MIVTFDTINSSWEYDDSARQIRQTISVGAPNTLFPINTWVNIDNAPDFVLGKRVQLMVGTDFRQTEDIIFMSAESC